jgi:O-acetyl-ADP-ribose deacetylase (regulator of RNase III)
MPLQHHRGRVGQEEASAAHRTSPGRLVTYNVPMSVAARISVVEGDITRLQVDAIVNAANTSLLGGGGVDGAIHRAAGPGLLEECRKLGGCPTGEARITGGYNLPARFVIHTVGPVYRRGDPAQAGLLRSCYEWSLRLAAGAGVASMAFPSISTGAYGYPKDEACDIAVSAVSEWLRSAELPQSVIFCCFDPRSADLYGRRLEANPRPQTPLAPDGE